MQLRLLKQYQASKGGTSLAAFLSVSISLFLLLSACARSDNESPRDLERSSFIWSSIEQERIDEIQDLMWDGRYGLAESSARGLLADIEASHGDQSLKWAEIADRLVEALERGGKSTAPEAEDLARKAVAVKSELLGLRSVEAAASMYYLGTILYGKAEYREALKQHETALAVREEQLGPKHPDVAWSLNYTGLVKWELGDRAGAEEMFRQSLHIREESLGPDHYDVSWSLNGLAGLHELRDDYEEAQRLYERALDIREKVLRPDHPGIAGMLNNLGGILFIRGDYLGARSAWFGALTIQERAFPPEHPILLTTLHNLAFADWKLGDYASARASLERQLRIREATSGFNHPDTAWSLSNLSDLLLEMGEHDLARLHAGRALEIRKQAIGPEREEIAWNLIQLANANRMAGDYEQARLKAERAVALIEKIYGEDSSEVGFYLGDLANVFRDSGEFVEARQVYEKALKYMIADQGPSHPAVATCLLDFAKLLLDVGESAGALDAALRAERISRSHLRKTARGLSERLALRYAATRADGLDIAISVAVLDGKADFGSVLWEPVIQRRALVFYELAARHRSVSQLGDLNTEVNERREILEKLRVQRPSGTGHKQYAEMIQGAMREKERAEEVAARMSLSVQKGELTPSIGLNEIMDKLPPDSALVAFFLYENQGGALSGDDPSGETKADKRYRSYVAFVLHGGKAEPHLVPLGEASRIDALIRDWKQKVSRRPIRAGTNPQTAEASYRRSGTALRRAIWDPVQTWMDSTERVFIVPDGAIHLVAFAALPLDEGSYLIENGPLIHYLTAERDLVNFEDLPPKRGGLLALGGPAFDDRNLFLAGANYQERSDAGERTEFQIRTPDRGLETNCPKLHSIEFKALPASIKETEEIVALWKATGEEGEGREGDLPYLGEGHESKRVTHLTGSQATEAAFKANATGQRVLHLATHGFFLGGQCSDTGDVGTRGIVRVRPIDGQLSPELRGSTAMILSGLAFAGVNHRGMAGPDEEDGILTAEEILTLDLEDVEWAVLSACDTGLGTLHAGEGVLGLRRAFQMAGVETVIMSLWTVDDEWTRQWMERLYRGRLLEGLGTAEAVREAGLTVLQRERDVKRTGHPFYWASFVAAGNWN